MESGADKPLRALGVGRGRPLAARGPWLDVYADAHKKIRGKTPTGKASFGLPIFLSEWRVRKAALRGFRAALQAALRTRHSERKVCRPKRAGS